MNAAVVYLIVTMGGQYGFSSQGYGAVSVTPTQSMSECEWLKQQLSSQIKRTDNLRVDDNEIIIECKQQ